MRSKSLPPERVFAFELIVYYPHEGVGMASKRIIMDNIPMPFRENGTYLKELWYVKFDNGIETWINKRSLKIIGA